MRLDGRVAVVTGGASGIGRATARALALAGAHVVVADIHVDNGRSVVQQLHDEGSSATFVELDVTDDESIEACRAAVAERAEPIDVLVNAAGWDEARPFLENTPDFMDKVVALNLLGPVKVTRRFLPAMVKARRGKIVNVSSEAGRLGTSGETVYAGAKGGVIAFTKSLAREMARSGINVNCVCPGPTDTPLFASFPDSIRDALIRAIPFRRLARPEDIADAILFFAGPMSDYITGQALSVSGGFHSPE